MDDPVCVGFYNYKGGAGKTTTCVNLGATMAHLQHKRVLLVDCDPQCNLSSFFFPDVAEPQGEEGEDEGDLAAEFFGPAPDQQPVQAAIQRDPLNANADALDLEILRRGFRPGQDDLFTFLAPALLNNRPEMDPAAIDRLPHKSLHPDVNEADSTLWLLPGSRKIVGLERMYGVRDSLPNGALFAHALRRVINEISSRLGIEYVLVDFGPSPSFMNQVWLSSVDFIMPCAFPDYFNASSIDGLLLTVLPKVLDMRNESMREQDRALQGCAETLGMDVDRLAGFRFPDRPLRLLPLLVTNYRRHHGSVSRRSSSWINTMKAQFAQQDVPQAVRDAFWPADAGAPKTTMVIAFLQTFNQTQQFSHEMRLALPCMTWAYLKGQLSQREAVQNDRICTHARARYQGLGTFVQALRL